jgi:hypothetical protein
VPASRPAPCLPAAHSPLRMHLHPVHGRMGAALGRDPVCGLPNRPVQAYREGGRAGDVSVHRMHVLLYFIVLSFGIVYCFFFSCCLLPAGAVLLSFQRFYRGVGTKTIVM